VPLSSPLRKEGEMKLAHEILNLNERDFGPLGREQIRKLCEAGLIEPFVPEKIRTDERGNPVISYGLAEAGYDIRLGYNFKIPEGVMDSKNPRYHDVSHRHAFELPPNSFVLGETLEWFDVPPDIRIIAFSKSTLLRVGLVTPISPLEPGWSGVLTLEIANLGRNPVVLYPGEGIAQLVFELIHPGPGYTGPYQNQIGVTGSLVRPDAWD